jgi:FkbM family methyltransferase
MHIQRDIFASVVDASNQKIEAVRNMQNSPLPLLLYGMGGYAEGLLLFLDKYGIKISAAMVDKEFYHEEKKYRAIPVYLKDEVRKHFDSYNVLIGFADFVKAEEKLSDLKGCKKIFFVDSTMNMDFFDYKYVKTNWTSFLFTYNLLEDELSKKTMLAFINGKISGYPKALYDLVQADQYFPADIVHFNKNEIFIDAGAYNGDTLKKFIKKVKGRYQKIYALEPDNKSYEQLCAEVKTNKFHDVELINKGAWKEAGTLSFKTDWNINARSAVSKTGDMNIEAVSIDGILSNYAATFIKADIEGAELEALQGAKKTMRYSKPKLAISAYHRPEDLIAIPKYIKKIRPDYKFYLRHHLHITHELVLYAT